MRYIKRRMIHLVTSVLDVSQIQILSENIIDRDEKDERQAAILTPFSIMAILSARRAVESLCVINITDFNFSFEGDLEMLSIVSKIWFCARASREDVYI